MSPHLKSFPIHYHSFTVVPSHQHQSTVSLISSRIPSLHSFPSHTNLSFLPPSIRFPILTHTYVPFPHLSPPCDPSRYIPTHQWPPYITFLSITCPFPPPLHPSPVSIVSIALLLPDTCHCHLHHPLRKFSHAPYIFLNLLSHRTEENISVWLVNLD